MSSPGSRVLEPSEIVSGKPFDHSRSSSRFLGWHFWLGPRSSKYSSSVSGGNIDSLRANFNTSCGMSWEVMSVNETSDNVWEDVLDLVGSLPTQRLTRRLSSLWLILTRHLLRFEGRSLCSSPSSLLRFWLAESSSHTLYYP